MPFLQTTLNMLFSHRESVAGSVIQVTGTVEFEYGLRTESSLEAFGALRASVPSLGFIPDPSGGYSLRPKLSTMGCFMK